MAPWNETAPTYRVSHDAQLGDRVLAETLATRPKEVIGRLISRSPVRSRVETDEGTTYAVRTHSIRKLVPIGVVSADMDVMNPPSKRVQTLRTAERLITRDRNRSYGEPTQNFQDIAELWNTQFRHLLKEGSRFSPADIAAAMVAVKLVRRIASSDPDHWIDMAGYAACGAECDADE